MENINIGYEKISLQEWKELTGYDHHNDKYLNGIPFDKFEINKLKNLKYDNLIIDINIDNSLTDINIDIDKKGFGKKKIYICKLPDEWYIIENFNNARYKCDQMDGLINILNIILKEYSSDIW